MTWLKQNLGSVITVGALLAGFISGYALLQYRVGELERIMRGNRVGVMERALEDEIQNIKTDFQNERVAVWKKLTELEAKIK